MQAVSGAYLNDLSGAAQLVFYRHGPESGPAFFPPQKIRSADSNDDSSGREPERVFPPFGRVRRRPAVSGFARSGARLVPRWISVFVNMMIDCLRVCHLRFQNEVIGG